MRVEAVERLLDLGPAMLIRVEGAKGSTPREAGAWMLVGARRTLGSIGGGQLEYMAIDAARALMARGGIRQMLDVPLGPEIGQCCGGRTRLTLVSAEGPTLERLMRLVARERAALPVVYILGAGHVGRALAACLALLPVRAVLVDGREDELAMAPVAVERVLTPLPEDVVLHAAPGSAFVVMTHDHALDFLVTREALARGDAAYVGMIGSRTKLGSFRRWLRAAGPVETETLVCPIGAAGRPDKRPEVIAAFVAAEILQAMTRARADRVRDAVA